MWADLQRQPWWLRAIVWVVLLPLMVSWWLWRRSWPVWGRLASIAIVAIVSVAVVGSATGGGSEASKTTAAPQTTSPSQSQPATSPATSSTTTPPPPAKPIRSSAAPATFYPIENDGVRDVTRFYFSTPTLAVDTVRVIDRRGRVIRTARLGELPAGKLHSWVWNGRAADGAPARPGRFHLQLIAATGGQTTRGRTVTVSLRPIPPRVSHVRVSPSPFYPIEQDGYRDSTTLSFSANTDTSDTVRVRTNSGRTINIAQLGVLGHGQTHTWQWNGANSAGTVQPPGKYWLRVVSIYYGQKTASAWHPVTIKKKTTSGGSGSNCTPGYSPCLVDHGGADYDCEGGSGNGPYYTAPGVTYHVSGSDPYGLDADGDGLGCE